MIYLGNNPVGFAVDGKLKSFTKYETLNMTFPNAKNDNNFMIIPVSFVPKIMMFYGGTVADGNIISGAYWFDINKDEGNYHAGGGTVYKNYVNKNIVASGVVPKILDTQPATSANQCLYYNNNVYISRTGSNGWWSSTDVYTFEFYG